MTSYSGSFWFTLNGGIGGGGWFSASFTGSLTLQDMVLGGGMLSGTAYGGGTLTITGYSETEGTISDSSGISFGPGPISGALDQFGLPLVQTLPEFGLAWTETSSFDALRTSLTMSGSGSFDTVIEGYQVFGSGSAGGSVVATSSAYSIMPLEAVAGEGTGMGGAYSFMVSRLGSTAGAGSILWQVAGSGAHPVEASDFPGYFLPSGIASFAPGETSQVISFTVAGDSSFEADEGFVVTLDNPIGEVIVVTSTAAGTVLNDDTTALVGIAALDADKLDGEGGTTDFFFELTRGGGTGGSAVIAWLAEPFGIRPADAADFVGGSFPVGTVTFGPGETSRTIAVPVAGDTLREGNEDFLVSLIALSGAELSTPFAQGTIRADEAIDDIIAVDAATGLALPAVPGFYRGPVAGLERELLAIVAQNVTAIASGPGWFIHSGAGDDALRALAGRNVLDGGTGSNFLTGGSGADSFFLDARGQTVPIWSTLVDFGAGDDATLWGIAEATTALIWQEDAGAAGYTGLTLHAARPGLDFASLTLAGYTRADLDSGRLVAGFGFDAGSGSDYLYLTLA